jgi:hypothetical protein
MIGFIGDNFSRLDFVVTMRRKETGQWGGVRGRHERTPVRLGSESGLAGRARPGAASCGQLPLLWLCFTLRGRGRAGWATLLWLGRVFSAGPCGSGGERGWLLGRARLSAEFWPTVIIELKNSFSFSKSLYNLQTNLNFDDFYSQNKI